MCVCAHTSEQKIGFQACLIAGTNSMEQSPPRGANRSAANHEINYILRNSKLHYLAHKSTPTLHILSQMNKVQGLSLYFFPIHFNIILPSSPTSYKRLYPSGTPKVFTAFLSHACRMFRPSHRLCYDYCLMPLSSGSFVFLSSVSDVKIRNYKTIILSVFLVWV